MGRFIDLTGKNFGKLVVIERVSMFKGKKPIKPHWKVQCACGVEKTVRGSDLTCNKILSCGCYMRQMTSTRVKKSNPQLITINYVIGYYRRNARQKQLPFELSDNRCVELFQNNCYYCERPPCKTANIYNHRKRTSFITNDVYNTYTFIYNGIDRVDNNSGYVEIPGQCVSCCSFCNNAKLDLNQVDWNLQISRWADMQTHQRRTPTAVSLNDLNSYQIDTLQEVIRGYEKGAKVRNLSSALTTEMFHTLFQQPCYYCGVIPSNTSNKYITKDGRIAENKGCPLKKTTEFDRTLGYYTFNGIDRRDNLLGYSQENCVTCCKICNHAKEDLPYEEFITNVNRLVRHQQA